VKFEGLTHPRFLTMAILACLPSTYRGMAGVAQIGFTPAAPAASEFGVGRLDLAGGASRRVK
jgi:hypothetical protein